jgi:hypothetical protein
MTFILFIVVISISLFGSLYDINVSNLLRVNHGLYQTSSFVFGLKGVELQDISIGLRYCELH